MGSFFICVWGEKESNMLYQKWIVAVTVSCDAVCKHRNCKESAGNGNVGGTVLEDDSFYLSFWKMRELFCRDFWPKFEALSHSALSFNKVTKTWVINPTQASTEAFPIYLNFFLIKILLRWRHIKTICYKKYYRNYENFWQIKKYC